MVSVPALPQPDLARRKEGCVKKIVIPQRTMHGKPDCKDAKGV